MNAPVRLPLAGETLDKALDLALERAIVGVFVRGFDARARAIRAEVGDRSGGDAALRLRAAADLEGHAAAVAALLPPDPTGTVTILLNPGDR